MKPLYALALLTCVACLCSCGAGKNSAPQSPIVAKWTLHQEHVVVTVDNVTQLDTVLTATGATYGTVQFNSDGSYSSSAGYATGNTSLFNKVPPSSQSSVGTYSYSGSAFTIAPGLSGWYSYGTGSSAIPTAGPNTIQVTSLSSAALNIHTSVTVGVTNGTGPHTIIQVSDFYYMK